jgi:hypothetical protein
MRFFGFLFLFTALTASGSSAERIGALELLPQASVGSQGILLSDLVQSKPDQPLPRLVLANPPPIGRPLFLSRFQINELLQKAAPDVVPNSWTGADRIKIVRAVRVFNDSLLKELLTAALQEGYVKDRGELELRLTRP